MAKDLITIKDHMKNLTLSELYEVDAHLRDELNRRRAQSNKEEKEDKKRVEATLQQLAPRLAIMRDKLLTVEGLCAPRHLTIPTTVEVEVYIEAIGQELECSHDDVTITAEDVIKLRPEVSQTLEFVKRLLEELNKEIAEIADTHQIDEVDIVGIVDPEGIIL